MEEQLENPEDMETVVSGLDDTVVDDDFSSLDDDLDSLRAKSTRTSDVYDVLDEDGGGLSGTIRGFSASQRLILALLIFIDVVACACAALLVAGVIPN